MIVKLATKKEMNKLEFRYLPAFAEFLRNEKLEDYIRVQLRYSRELKLPLLRFFENMSDEELVAISVDSHRQFLDSIINNSVRQHLEESQVKWLTNQLQLVDKYDVAAEDITLVSHIRKRAMLAFLPEFTAILADAMAIITEIDVLSLEADTLSTNTYMNILREKVNEHSHFIERITETSPGIIYVFDLLDDKEVYANKMMSQLLGYEAEDWQQLDAAFVATLIHPEDIPTIEDNQKAFAHTPDGEIRSIKYRIKDKAGNYRWMRTYESVFKRTPEGRAWQVIGIALDIHNEKRTADQLHHREQQLLEAQAIAGIGSFVWNPVTGEKEASPQFYKILDLAEGDGGMESFIRNIHPGDRAGVRKAIEAIATSQVPLDVEFRYESGSAEKILWLKATAGADNDIYVVQGTIMDVTERHHMVQKLRRSEEINKKAQALTHLGNWTWNLIRHQLEWSEEMYRIFELAPGTDVTPEMLRAFRHPDDVAHVDEVVNASMKSGRPYELYYRIVLKNGKVKNVHAMAEVLKDEEGKPYKLIGTLQDVTEREELIGRLQRSEALYKQAQSIAHVGNWMLDVKTKKMFWTDELYRIYGLVPQSEELQWEGFMNLVFEDDKDLVSAFVAEALRSGTPFDMYHRSRRSEDGSIRTVHVKGEALLDEGGKVYQLFGTTQDVTEQQLIEQELRDKQNFIKKIADATPSIIASYNVNTGKYRFVSQGLKTLLGYEPSVALEKGAEFFVGLMHPEDLAPVMERNTAALALANEPENEDTDMIVDFQYRMRRDDGEYRWFHTFGTIFDRNAEGKVEHVLNISIDITDKITAEQTVAEQQKFISHIAEASPTILYLFDLEQNKFLYLNKEVKTVLGYEPEEILSLGDKVYMYLHPEDTVKSPETYVKYKHDGAPTMHQFEGRIRSRSGEWKWLLTREVVFKRDADGKAIQVLGSALDISDRKEMENSISKKNLELEQSNANLEEFAYVASHDLQEPLRKISIFGDRVVLNHSDKLSEDGKLFLQKIIDSAKRMQGMINDLLSVSLISGDKSFQPYRLDAVLNDVLLTLEFKIEAKKAIIKTTPLPVAPIIPSQIRQLFQNLISNSLKFIPEDRVPEISISSEPLKTNELNSLGLTPGKQYIKILFSDNGIGFENEFASKIFTIFQRLHGKFEYEGTGIGLAICKKIVENHGGVIFAEGRPGIGATFTVIIPV
ncbi:MAG: hypothetical protein K0Q66_1336 [Chitinophagaceae bacterium]|nr:hypothetical protein [Chitinophagaceae bacterium]